MIGIFNYCEKVTKVNDLIFVINIDIMCCMLCRIIPKSLAPREVVTNLLIHLSNTVKCSVFCVGQNLSF